MHLCIETKNGTYTLRGFAVNRDIGGSRAILPMLLFAKTYQLPFLLQNYARRQADHTRSPPDNVYRGHSVRPYYEGYLP